MKFFVINLKRSYDIIAYIQKVVKLIFSIYGLVPLFISSPPGRLRMDLFSLDSVYNFDCSHLPLFTIFHGQEIG